MSIYEKAVIRDVYKKIRDDDIANKQYEIYRQQAKQSNQNKKKRRSIKIKVGILCVGSLAYATATLITR